MTSTLLILQFILAIVITIVVLLQKSSSIGLGSYSGSNDSVFGAKGPMNFLAKTTFIVGLAFVINTIALGYFYNKDYNSSITDSVDIQTLAPAVPTSATPSENK
jgi:preprotein translocase subunit SecG